MNAVVVLDPPNVYVGEELGDDDGEGDDDGDPLEDGLVVGDVEGIGEGTHVGGTEFAPTDPLMQPLEIELGEYDVKYAEMVVAFGNAALAAAVTLPGPEPKQYWPDGIVLANATLAVLVVAVSVVPEMLPANVDTSTQ